MGFRLLESNKVFFVTYTFLGHYWENWLLLVTTPGPFLRANFVILYFFANNCAQKSLSEKLREIACAIL